MEILLYQNLAKVTGSTAHERFSAAQICKIAETKPQVYTNTEVCVRYN
jgi:sugar (pentulose or hexulose) kinase